MKNRKYAILAAALLAASLCLGGCSPDKNAASSDLSSASVQSSDTVDGGSDSETAVADESEEKLITVTVVVSDTDSRSYEITTDADNLRDAMEAEGKIEGSESDFGLFITAVDGVTADESKQEWWCLTKDGEMWNYGIDSTKIENGDLFELTLTTGY